MKKVFRKLLRFFDQAHNLWRWFPIIWKDKDWDHHFIFEMLKFKLNNVADQFESTQYFAGYKREVQRIRLCIKLIESIQSEKYEMEAYSDLLTHDDVEKYLEAHKSTTFKVLTNKKYQWYCTDNRNLVAMNVGIYKHQQAKRILFTILEQYIERWWE